MTGWIETMNWSIFLRLCLAFILGGAIGLEREIHGRPAGLRTHIMVCLGATIIMISAGLLMRDAPDWTGIEPVRIDPGRIIAGIVTGIGFLGAGAIIRIGDLIRGLTTAACIWFAATLGVAIGSGYFGLAVVSTVLVLVILTLLSKLENFIPNIIYRKLVIKLKQNRLKLFEEKFSQLLSVNKMHIQDKFYSWDKNLNEVEIIYQIRTRNVMVREKAVFEIGALDEVLSIRWE